MRIAARVTFRAQTSPGGSNDPALPSTGWLIDRPAEKHDLLDGTRAGGASPRCHGDARGEVVAMLVNRVFRSTRGPDHLGGFH